MAGDMAGDMASQKSHPSSVGEITLYPRRTCTDTYLDQILDAANAVDTCADGVDNDGDGRVDQEDLMCALYQVESVELGCAQRDLCADDIDNDGDGLIDEADQLG